MPVERLKKFLDEEGVKYVTIRHSPAFTAQEIARSAHIPGQDLAKTVVVMIEKKPALAALPAPYKVDLEALRRAAGAREARLASEAEFRDLFPGCEVGAMPPIGHLYGLETYVDESLAEDEDIAFNAGSHTELVLMKFADFERVARPRRARIARREAAGVSY